MKSIKHKKQSKIIDAMHQTMNELHSIGLVDKTTMSNFDSYCLPKVKLYSPIQLKKLRNRFHVSQPVFAAYLNTTSKTIQQWEQGDRKPNSIALRLLNLIDHVGLNILIAQQ